MSGAECIEQLVEFRAYSPHPYSSAVRPAVQLLQIQKVHTYMAIFKCIIIYILCFLQVLDWSYFTPTTPNKDQQVDLLFCCLLVHVL